MSKEVKLQQLTTELQQAAKAYYTENREIMSNKEYDQKYDELVALEQELGTSLPDSRQLKLSSQPRVRISAVF